MSENLECSMIDVIGLTDADRTLTAGELSAYLKCPDLDARRFLG